jgi:hypothetical protein
MVRKTENVSGRLREEDDGVDGNNDDVASEPQPADDGDQRLCGFLQFCVVLAGPFYKS